MTKLLINFKLKNLQTPGEQMIYSKYSALQQQHFQNHFSMV